jgi:hypothetical protein
MATGPSEHGAESVVEMSGWCWRWIKYHQRRAVRLDRFAKLGRCDATRLGQRHYSPAENLNDKTMLYLCGDLPGERGVMPLRKEDGGGLEEVLLNYVALSEYT